METIEKIKAPFLSKINQIKQQFSSKKRDFEQAQAEHEDRPYTHYSIPRSEEPRDSIASDVTNKNRHSTEEDTGADGARVKHTQLTEWSATPVAETEFATARDMGAYYEAVFKKHDSRMKPAFQRGDSFKYEEKQVIADIYEKISDPSSGTVSFERIGEFFEGCQLYYRVYNIHPSSLEGVLRESAHHHPDKLTQ